MESDNKRNLVANKFKISLKTTLCALILTYLTTALLCFLTGEVAKLFGYELKHQLSLDILKSLSGLKRLYFLAYATVLMPVLEEIAFRFAAFFFATWFILWLIAPAGSKVSIKNNSFATGVVVANVSLASSILFSAAHYLGPAPFPDNAFIALVAFGLIQCWLYWRTSSLLAPVLNHVLFNVLNVVLFFIFGVE